MNIEHFVSLVRDMRKAQRAYFLNRQGSELRRAKELEAEVDNARVDGVEKSVAREEVEKSLWDVV